MAKKKDVDISEEYISDDAAEYQAMLLTELFAVINPHINKEEAYAFALDIILYGLSEETVEDIGLSIRSTAFTGSLGSDEIH